ncbi:MAG: serine hydrolase [Parerythrobacter sp.]
MQAPPEREKGLADNPLVTVLAMLTVSPAASAKVNALQPGALERRIVNDELGDIAAIGVDQGGETVYLRRFDGELAGHPIDIRSAGKSLTALAVGIAIDEGALALDTPVWPLLGSDPADPRNGITVHDLLTMSSPLTCDDWDRRSPGQEERMYRKRNWRAFAMALPLDEAFARDTAGQGRFSYCTAGVFLLEQAVEEAVGERFDLFMQTRVFDPLDIAGAGWRRSRSGEVQSGGQISMRAEDLLRIGRMVLDGGVFEERRVVSASWIKTMLTPHRQLGEHVHYGYLWWHDLVKAPEGYAGSWMMKGNGGNIVALYRERDAVIVVQAENYNREGADRNAFEAMWAILPGLPPPPVAIQ